MEHQNLVSLITMGLLNFYFGHSVTPSLKYNYSSTCDEEADLPRIHEPPQVIVSSCKFSFCLKLQKLNFIKINVTFVCVNFISLALCAYSVSTTTCTSTEVRLHFH